MTGRRPLVPDHATADEVVLLRRAVADAARRLAEAGVPSPRADAELLAAHVLGCRRADLLWHHELPGEAYAAVVARRAAREPVQHLTGEAPFRHLVLAVGPGVFVPRPETEVVAGAVVDALRAGAGAPAHPVVVDLGTGSGAIALAVATEVPGARVYAVESDAAAADWASRNLAGSGVELYRGDLAEALGAMDGTVDVVVSNPPYVPETSRGRLDPEVERYDPPAALWGGSDGLDVVRAVVEAATRLLRPGGLLVLEHDDTHAAAAPALLQAAGWGEVTGNRDLVGRPRFVTAFRP
ncbi:MAG: peptide chain release factor N(5)-glutamine methyltransferase [Actinomycetes bacterium]